MVFRRCMMLRLNCSQFYVYKLVCSKHIFFHVLSIMFPLNPSCLYKRIIYFFCSLSFSPSLVFCCLRKNLVGLWKGFFNQKRCKRKFLIVDLVATAFCILFNTNKYNKPTFVLYYLDLLFVRVANLKIICTCY